MTKEELSRPVVIIGSGPAGLTAAIYTARANLNPLLVDAPVDHERQTTPGGQLMITTDVENYPGFSEGIQGPDLMVEFRKQAERFGTEFLEEWITRVDLSERPFKLYTEDKLIKAETLIIASGASAKWLGIPGEAKTPHGFGGNGVSACATCDGPLPHFRNKHLVVVGGGDTAMEEATFLTRYAKRVFVVHRRDKLRASKIMQDKAFRNDKIEFIWNSDVVAIIGTPEQGVTGVHLRNVETTEEKVFDCYRQAVTAAGTGCMSAIDAERFLDHLPIALPTGEEVTIEGEHITPDHRVIILPTGEVLPNEPDQAVD